MFVCLQTGKFKFIRIIWIEKRKKALKAASKLLLFLSMVEISKKELLKVLKNLQAYGFKASLKKAYFGLVILLI